VSADVLRWLQGVVERLHGTSTALDVRAFVIDEGTRCAIPGAREGVPEQLFVGADPEDPEGMELALYIAPEIVQRLAADHPSRRLHQGNLEGFCIATEGVSHFVFVAARAQAGRPVSALELEIQAEVDKFVASWLLLAEQGVPLERTARQLIRRLFAEYELRDEVTPEESDRYHVASRVAQRFCGRLAEDYGRDRETGRIERAVHRFVQQGLCDKLRAA